VKGRDQAEEVRRGSERGGVSLVSPGFSPVNIFKHVVFKPCAHKSQVYSSFIHSCFQLLFSNLTMYLQRNIYNAPTSSLPCKQAC
jgi:hypothetical protein